MGKWAIQFLLSLLVMLMATIMIRVGEVPASELEAKVIGLTWIASFINASYSGYMMKRAVDEGLGP